MPRKHSFLPRYRLLQNLSALAVHAGAAAAAVGVLAVEILLHALLRQKEEDRNSVAVEVAVLVVSCEAVGASSSM
jgi:hypothetical protein